MNEFPIFGPGSQPKESDGGDLDILQLPSGMQTYSTPSLPEPEAVQELTAAKSVLRKLEEQLHGYRPDRPPSPIHISHLDGNNRELVDQVLGEGEVSIVVGGDQPARIQESVLAGVWRIQQMDGTGRLTGDSIEVGGIAQMVSQQAFAAANDRIEMVSPLPPGVLNAPPLFSEINQHCATYKQGSSPHVINLTLLPQTEEDLGYLQTQLGTGVVDILSRGYGNCRISSTGTRNVWWVQYFNSQDRNILNSLEITAIPSVACAAPEDIADSAQRLEEIMELYR